MPQALKRQPPAQVLAMLQADTPSARDRVPYLLNTGLLQYITGDFIASQRNLELAKQLMHELEALSITETLAAGTVNETLRQYQGTSTERVLAHQLLALNFLALKDLSAARVEMLQADVLMRTLSDAEDERGQFASAHFLSGLIYELNREWDNALISYRLADHVLQARNEKIPEGLAKSLLRLSRRDGFEAEYQNYQKRFQPLDISAQTENSQGELVLIYWQGLVSSKAQQKIAVFSPELEHHVSIALPYYPVVPAAQQSTEFYLQGRAYRVQLIEDINKRVRADLASDIVGITALTLARVVAKHQVIKKTREQGTALGLLAEVASILSEVADLRSWNTLPAAIYIERLSLEPGDYKLQSIAGHYRLQSPLDATEIKIESKKLTVALVNSFGDGIVTYGQK